MTRSKIPSYDQVLMLIELMEGKRWLATGHARTSFARDRMRAAWKEITVRLNRDESGCVKSWQQWSKYWKDKKAAIRKKASQIRMARQTGGDVPEDQLLSTTEEKIVAIMGGEGYFTRDKELEIDFSHDVQPGPSWSISNAPMENHPHAEVKFEVVSLPEVSPTSNVDVPVASPSRHSFDTSIKYDDTVGAVAERSTAAQRVASSIHAQVPRRRRLATTRRRLAQRSPPSPSSQRQSQMESLTERFLDIEERRVENERLLIENQQKMLQIFKDISESWSRQTQALQDLCMSIKQEI